MRESRIDTLWRKALDVCRTEGGIPLETYSRLLRLEVRNTALEQAACEVEGLHLVTKHYAALRIRKLKE